MRDRSEILKALRQTRAALPIEAQATREAVAEAFDWKTYVKAHPLIAVGLAAGIGYLIVPKGTSNPAPPASCPPQRAAQPVARGSEPAVAAPGMIASMAATVGALALRTAMSAAARQLFAARPHDHEPAEAFSEPFRPRPK